MKRGKMRKGFVLTALVAALCLALPMGASAEPPEGRGGGPPEGKGRQPKDPGGSIRGDLLGDLWVVVRDVTPTVDDDPDDLGDGEPIHFSWTWTEACYTPEGDFDPTLDPANCQPETVNPYAENGCVQPITFDPLDPAVIDPDTGESG